MATDTATSVDAALHALDWYEADKGKVDGLLLLQPTSPFRTKETVMRGIAFFKNNNNQTVLGVSPTHSHPMWTFKIDGNFLVPFMSEHGIGKRSQDLPTAYVVNGCFYLITPISLRSNQSFMGNNTIPLIIESQKEALDIDTELDWTLADFITKSFHIID